MSHRVTTETQIKNKDIAKQALRSLKIAFAENGDQLRITSGPMNNATIDCRTGRVSGDTDYGHTQDILGSVRQAYSEMNYRNECNKQGISITSRQIEGENVVLYARMA